MTLKEYQEKAMTTCMPSSNNVAYMLYNLIGEVGELCEKIGGDINQKDVIFVSEEMSFYGYAAKMIRKEPCDERAISIVGELEKITRIPNDKKDEIKKELGDILWQMSGLCSVMGWSLEEIAQQNLDKLASRQKRNVIDGNGDNR